MTVLIIPDIHTRYDIAEMMIEKENPDNIVFLGDYFDSLDDSLEITKQVAEWLKDSLKKQNRIHLLGNHDLSYLDQNYPCSEFSQEKLMVIKKVGVDLSKLQLHCWVDVWLCTHAGLSYQFYEEHATSGMTLFDLIEIYSSDKKLTPKLFSCSSYRGGNDLCSGIVWCDYTEFNDIPDVKQIFGHTKGDLRQTENHICLDTGLEHYAIHNYGKMEVKQFQGSERIYKLQEVKEIINKKPNTEKVSQEGKN